MNDQQHNYTVDESKKPKEEDIKDGDEISVTDDKFYKGHVSFLFKI